MVPPPDHGTNLRIHRFQQNRDFLPSLPGTASNQEGHSQVRSPGVQTLQKGGISPDNLCQKRVNPARVIGTLANLSPEREYFATTYKSPALAPDLRLKRQRIAMAQAVHNPTQE